MNVEKKPECPQCGSQKIKEKWVERKTRPTIQQIPFDEYAKQKIENWPQFQYSYGDISIAHINQLSDYAQLVLKCSDCGYTKVFDIPEHIPLRAEARVPVLELMVWCRKASVTLDAMPCEQLCCPFKKEKAGVIPGIKKCNAYALTLPARDWASAYHLPNSTTVLFF